MAQVNVARGGPGDEPRETAATTTGLVVGFVHARAGDAGVEALLDRAAVPSTAAELSDPANWFSYETRIRLFEAATAVLDDEDATFAIGATALENGLSPALILLLRAVGSPRKVYAQLPNAVTKFSTTSTMSIVELGRHHAEIDFRLHDGYQHSRLDCRYAQGLITAVPTVFGLPPARIEHPACESDGAESCRYLIRWRPRAGMLGGRQRRRSASAEASALREQLRRLQEDAADLVSTDDLDVTLTRITRRAAHAVIAPAHVLTVQLPDRTTPVVHALGLGTDEARRVAADLLADRDPGRPAVVVPIQTANHRYGQLAALYDADQRGLADEQILLGAYADHAAAALELGITLEAARAEADRARSLLQLATALAGTQDERQGAEAVVAALPAIVGAPRASLMRWDPQLGILETLAAKGMTPREEAVLHDTHLRPDDVPELARMLTVHEPILLRADAQSPTLSAMLHAVASDGVLAMPLVAGDELLGVVTASHDRGAVPADWPDAEAVRRLRGVADQATSAMYAGRLLTRIRHQADHDALTGLPDRARLGALLDEALSRSAAHDDVDVAVLFCDLDRFKSVNDRFGHATGDELLRQVAARLRSVLRGGDVVGRLSGDEFALVLQGVGVESVATEVADRVTERMAETFKVGGEDLRVGTSIGVAVQRPGETAESLLLRADAAMYEAKARGRNQIALARPDGSEQPLAERTGDTIRRAVAAGEMVLHFQPIVALGQGPDARDEVVGHEALARWQHPTQGLLGPGAFLPVAEQFGSVVDLDLWALRAGLAAASAWGEQGSRWSLAVNLSARTLVDPRLPSAVRLALAESGVAPERLTLEIVESRALSDLPGVVDHLLRLRRLGVRTALDDFGTGFSTLTWLQRLPIDRIKLDRSFVTGIDDDPRAVALLDGVLALGRALDLSIVAEGVEHASQLELLRRVGCPLVQGYHLARPVAVPTAVLDTHPEHEVERTRVDDPPSSTR
ncbi:MAG: DUF2378 family protein [Nitriliruptoraceae bacterium]|nr:DUF2378 family protein [Nitriliruptoraceae bacterium]